MIECCILGPSHLDDILALEGIVLSSLERPDLLRRNTPEMWRVCLLPPHTAWGVLAEGRLVALAVLYVPVPGSPEDLASLLKAVPRPNGPAANYKICLVHPAYRGHGLQCRLGQLLEQEARRQGITLLCSTASPHNAASIRSLKRLGYRLDSTLTKYGFERNLYVKEVNSELTNLQTFIPSNLQIEL